MTKYYVGIDIGGTFTDCAVLDENGHIATIAKSLSQRQDPGLGVLDVLSIAARQLGQTRQEFLTSCRFILHGCTVATNAMVERRGVKTGLITTAGHEDAIFIGKVLQKAAGLSEREMIHQSHLDKANPPLIEPEDVVGIVERIDRDGLVLVPLDLDQAEAAVKQLLGQGVDSLAINLLWSFRNPAHEVALGEMVNRLAPDLFLSISHQLCPVLGEYERSVTTGANAYVGPKVIGYLERLEKALNDEGYASPLLVAHAMGGLTTLTEVRQKPLLTLDSGPVSGVLGAKHFGAMYGEPNILCADVGGTTFDVSLIEGGRTVLDEEPVIGQYQYLMPKIAVRSIGAGGGSLLWIDDDGLLKVGPRSAGVDPGPACYGLGGTEPTITDINVVLGYINPTQFLGGRHQLAAEKAMESLLPLAEKLSLSPLEVAAGAFRIANSQMADLARQVTIDQGYDPRAFALFCYGGAGPIHIAFLARELRIKRIYVPSFATVFSALGMLTGGILHTRERAWLGALPLSEIGVSSLEATFSEMEAELQLLMDKEAIPSEQRRFQRYVSIKYKMQPTSLAVAWDGSDSDDLLVAFEKQYSGLFGPESGFRQAGVEVVKCRLDASAETVLPVIQPAPEGTKRDSAEALKGEREAYFSGTMHKTKIYSGEKLLPGMSLSGPAIVERMGDTVVLPPGTEASVDGFENLVMELSDFGKESI